MAGRSTARVTAMMQALTPQSRAGRSDASAASRRVTSLLRPPKGSALPRPSRPRRTITRRSAISVGTAAICASEMPAQTN